MSPATVLSHRPPGSMGLVRASENMENLPFFGAHRV
jgi:hypothetical protein